MTAPLAAALVAVLCAEPGFEGGFDVGQPDPRVIGAGSRVLIEIVDWSDKLASPYQGKECVAMNDLWPAGFSGELHQGRLRCGGDVFSATAVKLKVLARKAVPDDGRFYGEVVMPGARVVALAHRDAVTPPLVAGADCVVAKVPAKRVGPGYLRAMLWCDGALYEARAVALRVDPADAAFVLSMTAAELGCADGRWRDCAKAGGKRLDRSDGPMLERACAAEDPHACRDLGRWTSAWRRGETRRELELQEQACLLGSQLACFERARARNLADDMPSWCDAGFAPACRFLQQLHAKQRKEAERWRDKACTLDPGCGSY